MGSVLKRIKQIAQREAISLTALEASIGASKGVFSRALANGTDIQSKWLVGIAEIYPEYSADWLLTGKGDMLRNSIAGERVERYQRLDGSNSEENAVELIAALRQVIRSQEKTISALEKQVVTLENQLGSHKK